MTESIVSHFVLRKWNAWAQQHKAVVPDSVPKRFQRKLNLLAKAAFNFADKSMVTGEQIPTVFYSANGEICKSLEMLRNEHEIT